MATKAKDKKKAIFFLPIKSMLMPGLMSRMRSSLSIPACAKSSAAVFDVNGGASRPDTDLISYVPHGRHKGHFSVRVNDCSFLNADCFCFAAGQNVIEYQTRQHQ